MSTIEIRKKVHEFIDESDDNIINAVYALLKAYHNESAPNVSIEQYNKELNEAEARIDKGEFITQEELEKEIKKW
jgi:hypothetical protein